jgi:hypothetical protein
VRDGVAVFSDTADCGYAWLWDGGTTTPLLQDRAGDVYSTAVAVDGTVYVVGAKGCLDDTSHPGELTALAPDGTTTLLAPVPAGDVVTGLHSFVVARTP